MSRTDRREEIRRKNTRLVVYLICLFITATSLMFAKMVSEENNHIREIVNTNREIPLSVKEELGLR